MRLKSYKNDLKKRLRDPEYAAEYLAQTLGQKDSAAFLIALKDVVEAGEGMGSLAGRVSLKRPSLYKILSKKGNPTLATLQEILKPLGLRVSVVLDEAAWPIIREVFQRARCVRLGIAYGWLSGQGATGVAWSGEGRTAPR